MSDEIKHVDGITRLLQIRDAKEKLAKFWAMVLKEYQHANGIRDLTEFAELTNRIMKDDEPTNSEPRSYRLVLRPGIKEAVEELTK